MAFDINTAKPEHKPTKGFDISSAKPEDNGLRSKADPSEFLSIGERAVTGFEVNPQQVLEQKRADLGLASGTALEPTPFTADLVANIMDIPADLADMLGPMFPVIGNIMGGTLGGAMSIPTTGGVAAPLAIAKGGVAGAVGGKMARQAVGEFIGLESKGFSDRAKRVAMEGAFGVVGEGAVLTGNALIKATKSGIIKAGEKVLSKKGLEGFAKGFGKIVRKTDPKIIEFSINDVHKKNTHVLSKEYAREDFAKNFIQKLFSGKDNNMAKQIKTLSNGGGAKEPIRQMYKLMGISDDAIEQSARHGANLQNFGSEQSVKRVINKIVAGVPKAFDDAGKELGLARKELIKSAGGVDVSPLISQVNKQLGDSLVESKLLTSVSDGVYQINPNFAITSLGRSQSASFAEIITKFFGKSGAITDAQTEALKKAIVSSDQKAINAITRGKSFTAATKSTYREFAESLGSLDVQISGREFQQLGKLSPHLAQYVRGVRAVTTSVADQVGNSKVKMLTKEFSDLAENLGAFKKAREGGVENALNKLISPKNLAEVEQAKTIDEFIGRTVGTKALDTFKAFKAAKEMSGIENSFATAGKRQGLVNLMKNAFSEGNASAINLFERNIDKHLPKGLRFASTARRHTAAEALHADTLSILSGRFLSSGLGLPTAISTATGGAIGGFQGATAGLGAGLGLQNPKIIQALVKAAAKAPENKLLQVSLKELNRPSVIGGTQLLKTLVDKN